MKPEAGSRLVEKLAEKMALNEGNVERLFVFGGYGLILPSIAPVQLLPSFEE
jgi:hypothetical protein